MPAPKLVPVLKFRRGFDARAQLLGRGGCGSPLTLGSPAPQAGLARLSRGRVCSPTAVLLGASDQAPARGTRLDAGRTQKHLRKLAQ